MTMPFRNPELPVAERVRDLLARLTPGEKASQLVMSNAAVERLGIGAYHWWNEALHGFARSGTATVFPQAIGLAASWSPGLLRAVADVAATEGRAKYNEELAERNGNTRIYHGLTIWSPNINIFRDPRWGRGQETYGEDPVLTGSLGAAFCRGLQGEDPRYLKTAATLKHFAVHSGPEALRHRFDARVSEKDLRDTYLPAFEEGIREGKARSLMSAYNGFNGSPCVVSHRLLTKILREEWGFDGAVVGDVDNVNDLYRENGHGWAKTGPEAVAGAIRAGNELRSNEDPGDIVEALERGLLSAEDVDRALGRLLKLRFLLGQFDPPERAPWHGLTSAVITSPAHRELAYEAARQSLVLLKNDGVLPLDAERLKTVAVLGPTADDLEVLQGNYAGTPYEPVTILQGLKRKLEPLGIEVLQELDIPFAVGHSTRSVPIPPGVFFTDEAAATRGLVCRMYNGAAAEGAPVREQVVNGPALEWNAALPRPGELDAERATVTWSGFLKPAFDGEYTFHARLHGAVVVELDGKPVLTGRAGMGIAPRSAKATLAAGRPVPIAISWTQTRAEGFFALEWDPADGGRALEEAYGRALAAAHRADVVFLALGLSHLLEGEEMANSPAGFSRGDRTTLALPAPQQRLLDEVSALGKPVVLLLSSGSAVAFDPGRVNAALQTWYYGEQGGRAIADALFGAFSPAGRLPVTFYRSDDDLPPFEDYAMKGRTYRYFTGEPLFAFGHGLTYTAFRYADLAAVPVADGLEVTLTLTNSGEVASEEVVQLYASRLDRGEDDPLRWLVAYRREPALAPGETRTVTLAVPRRRLALWNDAQGAYTAEPGELTLAAGPASDEMPVRVEVEMG